MFDIVNNIFICNNEASEAGERFAECTHGYIYFIFKPPVLCGSPSVFAQNTDRMGIINIDTGFVMFGQFHDPGKICNISLHTEHTVCYNKPPFFSFLV